MPGTQWVSPRARHLPEIVPAIFTDVWEGLCDLVIDRKTEAESLPGNGMERGPRARGIDEVSKETRAGKGTKVAP